MKTIFIGKTSAPSITAQIEDSTFIQSNDYLSTVYLMLNEDKTLTKANFILVAERESEYTDVKTALKYKLKVHLNNKTITTSTMSKFDAALLTFKLSRAELPNVHAKESVNLVKQALSASPAKMSISTAIQKIKSELSVENANMIINMFEKQASDRAAKIKTLYSISEDNQNVEFLDLEYGPELIEFMLKNKGDYLLNAPMASGKSRFAMLPFYEKACELRRFPMLVNGSRVLSKSYFDADDKRHYQQAYKADEMQLGWVGTVNSLLLDSKYSQERALSEVLVCDEIENTLNHSCGDAVLKGNLESKITALGQFEKQYKKSDITLSADAFLSDFTVNQLAKLSKEAGKKLYVINKKVERKLPVVKVMSKNLCAKLANEAIEDNKKIGVFCDYAHGVNSKYNAQVSAINPDGFEYYSQIDSNFMNTEELAAQLSNPDQFASDNQVIYTNGAASVGLSIQNGEYRDTFVFGCGTVTPFDLIQSPARFRDYLSICLNISTGNNNRKTTAEAVLTEILLKERSDEEFSIEELVKFKNNTLAMRVCERIAYKNRLHNDYANTVLIAMEQMGYEIQYIADCKKDRDGGSLNKKGKEAEKASAEVGIKEADLIESDEAKSIRAAGDVNSKDNKYKLHSFYLRNFYNVEKVTPELLSFDKFGIGTSIIKTLMIARDDVKLTSTNDNFAAAIVNKFFELTELCPHNFGEYINVNANKFQDFVRNESITIECQSMTAKEAFVLAFPNAQIAQKLGMSTVGSVLKTAFNAEIEDLTNKKIKGKSCTRRLATTNVEVEFWYNKVVPNRTAKELDFAA
jgi:hypothetical protein